MNRDEIAQAMQDSAGQSWGDEAHFQRFAAFVASAEREACAKVCDDLDAMKWTDFGEYKSGYSEAIRERGKDPMPLFDDWGMK